MLCHGFLLLFFFLIRYRAILVEPFKVVESPLNKNNDNAEISYLHRLNDHSFTLYKRH